MKQVYKEFKFSRKFGTETEVNPTVRKSKLIEAISEVSNRIVKSLPHANSINNKAWHVKIDGSCGENDDEFGYEIASFVGHRPDDINHISEVIKGIKATGVKVNNRCGFHIHCNASDFSVRQMGILLGIWLKIEAVVNYIVSVDRPKDYCCPLTGWINSCNPDYQTTPYTPHSLYYFFHPEDEDEEIIYRMRTLNVTNYSKALLDKRCKRATLELRFPESTLEHTDVEGWLRLFINFVETAKHSTMPSDLAPVGLEEALSLMGLHHTDDTFYIFTPVLHRTRVWVLNRIIRHLRTLEYLDSFEDNLLKTAKKLLKRIELRYNK